MKTFIFLGQFNLGGPELIILFAVVLLLLLPQIFYLLTLQRAMQQVSPDLQKMSPGMVWLSFIPVFNLIWNFIMVGHIANSLRDEFRRRNMPLDAERPGYQAGLAMSILYVASVIPVIGGLFALAGFILWIIYWVKIAGYKKQLEMNRFQFGNHNPNWPGGFQQQQSYGNYGRP
jgi:hypothetical protein